MVTLISQPKFLSLIEIMLRLNASPVCASLHKPHSGDSAVFKTGLVYPLLAVAFLLCVNSTVSSAAAPGATSTRQVSVSIVAGRTQHFQVAISNSSTTTWYVNGIAGGNNSLGKVTSGGVYTAPAEAPEGVIELTVLSSAGDQPLSVAHIKVLDDPAILEAHQRWINGAVEAAAIYGCTHPIIQQDTTENVAEALKVYLQTADRSSCLILSPISSDPESTRYSYAWGGNVDGVDIYYISDVSRPRILLGTPVSGE
jgi:hydrogenase/urease accessory protein HupE